MTDILKPENMNLEVKISIPQNTREILRAALQLDERADNLTENSLLLGEIPELDSMAVAMVIGAIEDEYDIQIEADEISGETFETFGSLCDFIKEKTAL
jgi:acyl carrier protein